MFSYLRRPGFEVEEVIGLKVVEGGGGGVAPTTVGEFVPVRRPVHVAVGTTSPENGTHLKKKKKVTGSMENFYW
jgi:hypothetical protein